VNSFGARVIGLLLFIAFIAALVYIGRHSHAHIPGRLR
jgi:hypothetical protein